MKMEAEIQHDFFIQYFFSDLHQGITKLDIKWVSKSAYEMSFLSEIQKMKGVQAWA